MRSSLDLDHDLRNAVNQAILGAIPDILIRVGIDGQVREVIRPRGQEILEHEAGWNGFMHRPEGREWLDRVRRCIGEGTIVYERLVVERNGQSQHFEVRLAPNGPEEALGLLRDVSVQVHAQQDLARQEVLLSRLAQTLPTLMFLFNRPSNAFRWVNQSLALRLGYPETGDLHTLLSWLHPEDARSVQIWIRQVDALEDGDVLERELRVRNQQGNFRIFRCRLLVFERAGGRIISVCGMMEDVTELRRTEQQVQRATLLEATGRVTGILAHEFNNSLTIIHNLSELLLEQLPEGQSKQDALEIKRVADDAVLLTRRLQSQSNATPRGTEALNLSLQLQSFLPFLTRLFPSRVHTIRTMIHQDLMVTMNLGDFEQLLVTLVLNLPEGSDVEIRLEPSVGDREQRRPARVAATCVLARVQLLAHSVKRGGERVPNVVGVASLRRIANDAGGWFEAYSAEDGTLTFQVLLPLVQASGDRVGLGAL